MIKGYVWWSIYVRTKSVQKMRVEHLPPIEQAIGPLQFKWQVVVEKENPHLVRAVNYQNLSANRVEGVILPVLQRAYRLSDNWNISGLGDLDSGEIRHVIGGWNCRKPSNKAPALESVMFEIQPGQIAGMTSDGGWSLAGEPGKPSESLPMIEGERRPKSGSA